MNGTPRPAKRGRSHGLTVMMRAFGTIHRQLYRLSGGKVGATVGGTRMLLLTTTERKTGQQRTWPVNYLADGDDLIVVASAGGQPQHPAWYLNLQAQPWVRVQVGDKASVRVARTAQGEERARLWARFVQAYPGFAGYQQKTSRELPVVILRAGESVTGHQAATR